MNEASVVRAENLQQLHVDNKILLTLKLLRWTHFVTKCNFH
jgi:hypothetical protein